MDDKIEKLVGELWAEFYKLRQAKEYQNEYDTMGTLINMLTQDRQHIRKTYKVDI